MDDEDQQPSNRSDIHGHVVYCDDADARQYLRQLDNDEAETYFEQAKKHQRADFEVKTGGTRHDFHMIHKNGAYWVIGEGDDTSSSDGGWF